MKILIADDEKDLTEVLSAILKRNNYSVDIVYNGQDALDFLKYGNYDAVILDVMMDKLNGFEVLDAMRKNGINTPVLMLSARSELDDRVKGLDLGADDYLPKPFDAKELLARLRVIIRRNSESASNILTFGDLNLDLSSYFLFSGEKNIRLSNKEFQIMELLLLKKGKVISTETIMSKVWDYDDDIELNVVWVFISGLRKKIASITDSVELKSNRGIGYSLELKQNV